MVLAELTLTNTIFKVIQNLPDILVTLLPYKRRVKSEHFYW